MSSRSASSSFAPDVSTITDRSEPVKHVTRGLRVKLRPDRRKGGFTLKELRPLLMLGGIGLLIGVVASVMAGQLSVGAVLGGLAVVAGFAALIGLVVALVYMVEPTDGEPELKRAMDAIMRPDNAEMWRSAMEVRRAP